MSTTPPDDLDAVKLVVAALTPFQPDDQERILRWSREKLGLIATSASQTPATPTLAANSPIASTSSGEAARGVDIKSFVAQKQPASDNQFAATVAYYYTFEAPEKERKASVGSEDLQEACRKAGRSRLGNPGQTLRNAAFAGLLDKGDEKGLYKINSVGENLVAMTLPGSGTSPSPKKARKKASPKKAASKKVRSTK